MPTREPFKPLSRLGFVQDALTLTTCPLPHEMTPPRFDDFESAGRAVLQYLQARTGFGMWMLTRTEREDWIVLQAEDRTYGVSPGAVFRWADSFCSEMVKGNGPCIAPDSSQIEAYAAAPIGRQVPIRAYVGVPLLREDGTLFGTLCGIDPEVQPDTLADDQPLIELLASLLSTLLNTELRAQSAERANEQLEQEAQTDAQTGLANRGAWNRLVALEEDRCRRYGHRAAIFMIDLDGLKHTNDTMGHAAGDDLIIRAAQALREAARTGDVVARIGGDEFGLLAIECDTQGADALLARIRESLTAHAVEASVGVALRDHGRDLESATKLADERMYADKKRRHKSRETKSTRP